MRRNRSRTAKQVGAAEQAGAAKSDGLRELREVERAFRNLEKAQRRLDRKRGKRNRPTFTRWAFVTAALVVAVCLIVPPFRFPVEGRITSGFFPRLEPDGGLLPSFEMHRGLDIGARRGIPVRAARSGIVVTSTTHGTYGNVVEIRHLFGVTSFYAHMSDLSVSNGDLVLRGGTIGRVGSTGRSTGPHLHFEIRAGGRRLPPRLMLVFHSLRLWIFRF